MKETLCYRCVSVTSSKAIFEPISIFILYSLQGQHVSFLYYLLCRVVICCICLKTTPLKLLRQLLVSTSVEPQSPSPQGPAHVFETRWMGTCEQVLGFLLSCIPNHMLSLYVFTDKLRAFLALLKCQSQITSLQRLCELLPLRTKLRCWVAAWWLARCCHIYTPRSCHLSPSTGDPDSCLWRSSDRKPKWTNARVYRFRI